jgi:hypothetical protein
MHLIILTSILIPIIQIFLLFFFKFLPKEIHHHSVRFKISILISWMIFILFIFFLKLNNIKLIFSCILFILSANIFIYTFWSLITHGFTINLLYGLVDLKKPINIDKWIKIYTKDNKLTYFTNDRLPILLNLSLVKRNNNKISITPFGHIVNILLNFSRIILNVK